METSLQADAYSLKLWKEKIKIRQERYCNIPKLCLPLLIGICQKVGFHQLEGFPLYYIVIETAKREEKAQFTDRRLRLNFYTEVQVAFWREILQKLTPKKH